MPVSRCKQDPTADSGVQRHQNINGASRKQWRANTVNLKMRSEIHAGNLKEPDFRWPDFLMLTCTIFVLAYRTGEVSCMISETTPEKISYM